MKSSPVCADNANDCGLFSPDVNLLPNVWPSSPEDSRFKVSLPSPLQARKSRPLREASAGLEALVSGRMTLFVKSPIFSPDTFNCATFRLSFPSPFQAIKSSALCAHNANGCGLVSPEVNLWPKVWPLSDE